MKYLTISGLSRFLNNLKKLIPSKTSQLTNDSGYITADQVSNVTGYSKTEVDQLINQADSNAVHLTGNETIEGSKTFTSFPTLYYGTGDNYLSFLKSSSLIFGTAPQNTQTYSIRCLDKNDIIISEFSSQAQANGINNLSLRVRNTDGTNIYDRRINFNINTSGLTYFAPNIDNICSLGVADHQWKSVYANSYYLGSTAFGDIVTHNANEFLTSHQSLSNYVTLDGAQTISGNKTWTGLNTYQRQITLKDNATIPAGGYGVGLDFYDYAGNRYGYMQPYITPDGVKNIVIGNSASGYLQFNTTIVPYNSGVVDLGSSTNQWKSVYANSYYLGSTQFGDIVTHNASEFLTSHQSLSNYVTTNTAQTISGKKNFTTTQILKNTAITDHTAVPSADTSIWLHFHDNNGKYWGGIGHCYFTTGGSEVRIAMSNWTTSGTQGYWHLDFGTGKSFSSVFFRPSVNNTINLGTSDFMWKAVYSNSYYLGTTAFGDIVTHNANEFLTSHQAVSNSAPTLAWGTTSTIGTIGGTALTVKMPANPNTNTTYSAGTGLSLSGTTFSVTSTAGTSTLAWNSEVTLGTVGGLAIKAKLPANPNTDTDTKNTAGSTNTSSKIFLIGATSQAANPQTYSHDTAYVGTDGCLYSGGTKVLTAHQSLSNYSTLANTVKSLSISGKTITVTPGSGDAYTLTTQDTTYSNFVKSGSGAKAGLVPSPGTTAGTTKYLREDGTWQVPPDHTYTVNNATLTIQKNGSNVATFTSNASSNVTANITVPTKTSELTNDSGFLTSHQSLSNYLTKTTNVSEMGRYIDMHYDNATAAYDYDVRLYVSSQGTAKGGGALTIAAATAYAPAPAADADDTRIATTAWVKDRGYLTSHQSLSNYSTKANTVKSLSISGKTITVTPGSGDAYTLTTQDTVYTHPTSAGNKHIPSGGASGNFLVYSAAGTAAWSNTVSSVTVTNNSSNGIKFGSYTVYVG